MTALGEIRVPTRKLRHAVARVRRAVEPDAGVVTAFHDGVVTLRTNRRVDGFHESVANDGYVGVRAGDLVIHGLDLVHGAVGVSDSSGQITPVCWVTKAAADMDAQFVAYALRAIARAGYVRANAKGVRSAGADYRRWETLAEVPVPSPSLRYQATVAELLDQECARIAQAQRGIDELVGGARALTESETERQLLALLPDYPMRKIGWEAMLLGGFAFDSESFVHEPDQGVRLLRGINLTADGTRWDDVVYWPTPRLDEVTRFGLRAGDLVVGLNRPWIAGGLRCAMIGPEDLPALLLQRVACLRPQTNSALLMPYLRLWLRTSHFRTEVRDDAAVTFPMLEPGRMAAYRIPVASTDVQAFLVRQTDERTRQLSRLTTESTRIRETLVEYRDALITEAVTGKRDVTRLSDAQMEESLDAVQHGERPGALAS